MADYETMPAIMSRKEAKALGLKSYFDGQPCPKGHIAKRRVDSYGCVECHKAIANKWVGNSDPRRLSAQADGKANYMGDPCVKGHDGLRITKTGRCIHCARAHVAEWRKAHPEYDATGMTRERRRKNPEKHRKNVLRWARKNPEMTRAMLKKWKTQNPETARRLSIVAAENRRAKELANGGKFTKKDIDAMFVRQNGICAACPSTEQLEVDHIMPISLGGSSDPSNLQLLCRKCNRNKSKKHPNEWKGRFVCE